MPRRGRCSAQHLADFQLTQAKLAEMATMIDAAALLTYRAAWTRDVPSQPTRREAAMAKMTATENAQIVIDQAVQMFGGRGVRSARSSSGSIARSGRCASMRARPRCRS